MCAQSGTDACDGVYVCMVVGIQAMFRRGKARCSRGAALIGDKNSSKMMEKLLKGAIKVRGV